MKIGKGSESVVTRTEVFERGRECSKLKIL